MDYSTASISELLFAGFKLFWANLKNIAGVIAIQMLTLSFLLLIVVIAILNLAADSTGDALGYGPLIGLLVGIYICLSICLIFPVAYIKKFHALDNNHAVETRVSLLQGLSYVKPLLIWFTLYFLILTYTLLMAALVQRSLIFLPLIIPGIVFVVSLCLSPFFIVHDDMTATSAIKQSHLTVWRSWWKMAGYLFIAIISVMLVYFSIALPFTFFFGILSAAIPLLIGALSLFNALILSALLPFLIALIYPYYLATK
ncbi:MAG: hypothetical protein OEZ33_08910 [Gammaproteobacteria bacterium]|nr:hypothetical protein [Gammaproteobacteria bacterium]MDH5778317.1 hypothetical protein [Gammaproteobacteria bacterium]